MVITKTINSIRRIGEVAVVTAILWFALDFAYHDLVVPTLLFSVLAALFQNGTSRMDVALCHLYEMGVSSSLMMIDLQNSFHYCCTPSFRPISSNSKNFSPCQHAGLGSPLRM